MGLAIHIDSSLGISKSLDKSLIVASAVAFTEGAIAGLTAQASGVIGDMHR